MTELLFAKLVLAIVPAFVSGVLLAFFLRSIPFLASGFFAGLLLLWLLNFPPAFMGGLQALAESGSGTAAAAGHWLSAVMFGTPAQVAVATLLLFIGFVKGWGWTYSK